MEAFKFKLEKILELRTTLAKASEQALMRKNVQINAIKKNIEDKTRLRLSIRKTTDYRSKTIEDMRLEADYESRLLVEIKKLENETTVLETEKVSLQYDYLEKTKQKRVLELLKEKELKEYKTKRNRYHEKVMDDLISSRYTK